MERLYIACSRFEQVKSFVRKKETEPGSAWYIEERIEPLSSSQIYRYLQKAKKRVAKRLERNRNARLDRHFARRLDMYNRAIVANDVKTALAVAADEAKLENLYPAADEALLAEMAQMKEENRALRAALARMGIGQEGVGGHQGGGDAPPA